MKSLNLLIITLLSVLSFVSAGYLDNLDRNFDKFDNKVIDISVTISAEEYQQLIQKSQVSPNQVQNGSAKNLEDFETKNAVITITYGDKVETQEGVEFKTGGMFGRSTDKVGYNFKLKTKFAGRKSFRIRSDANDNSYLRSKLSCDILNRAGLPSVQSANARLYVNGQFFGLYVFFDSVKKFMVKKLYQLSDEDEEKMILYQCKYDGMKFDSNSSNYCLNAIDEDTNDMTELNGLISAINSATTIADVENIMDVDEFLKTFAIEWLIGSFDHTLILGHNFNLFKRPSDNKWTIILYDFDNTFGQNLGPSMFSNVGWNSDVNALPIEKFARPNKLLNLLIFNDSSRFISNVKEVMETAFNPTLLNNHINDLKSVISSYVKEDLTPINNQLPGRINNKGSKPNNTYSDFENNTEYSGRYTIGLKKYIQNRFEATCKQYNFNKTEIENANVTPKSYFTVAKENEAAAKDKLDECWSRPLGFLCCNSCNVLFTDESGKWGVENNYWCGINTNKCKYKEAECSSTNEYPCCSSCLIDFTDASGRFGYENGQWCNVPFNC